MPLPESEPLTAELLGAVAVPLLRIDAARRVSWANDAAVRILDALPGHDFLALWQEPEHASQLLAAADVTLDLSRAPALDGTQATFRICSRPLAAGGWLLTLQDITPLQTARAEAADLAERLDLARDFGRLGLWERNVRTLHGSWDREVLRFWGLDPNMATPDFNEAKQNIVDSDREVMDAVFRQSLLKAGRYSVRYRVRGFDGTLRRIHSQWVVKDGADGRPERMLGLMMDDSEPYALAQTASELESQLALAVDLGGIAIWRLDLASGRMHYSSHGWRALGREPQPQGLSLEEARALVHPEDLPRVLAAAEASMRRPHPVDVEARYLHADGSWRPQLLRTIALRDSAGQTVAFLGVALDLTERQEERRRAQDMARRFEAVTRAAGIGHWIKEPGQQRAVWSEQLRLMFGLAPDAEVPSLRDWFDRHVHPEDVALVQRTLQTAMDQRSVGIELAFRARRADGEWREFFSHSQVESSAAGPLVFGVVIDLTDRRRSEQALRSAEQRVALAARGAGLGTWEMDLHSACVQWDPQMWRLRGLPPQPEAMSVAQMLSCVHPQDRDDVSAQVGRAERSGQAVDLEFRVVWPDGQVRWLASRSTEVRDPDGVGRRRIGVNWDITDSRTADAVRSEREIALRESASKSRFLARMSHELRTPLNAVLGFSQMLLDEEDGADPASAARRQRLGHIGAAGQHLLTLINDVLDLAGLQGGEVTLALQPVALRPLVEQTLPLLGPLQEQQPVRIERGALDLHVLADPTRLRQVLLNLLSNALKYNRPSGSVHIEAAREAGQVVLRVADTGRGLSASQLQQLFEPFNRLGADREGIEGTGIGLAIVKSLVERMGGSVQVRSHLGVGSVFELRLAEALPAAVAETAAAAAPAAADAGVRSAASPAAASRTAARTVLYIEDNPVNALIVAELLARRSDLTLHVAADGASGIRLARTLQPDLILLDMQLPDFDGYEVLRRLRGQASTATVPCIALSANAMPEDIERARRAGVADYWTKPLDFRAFLASLDRLFAAAA